MKFARTVYLVAGIYGLLVMLPMYFAEPAISADYPPAITHPEFFYGFIGVTVAWQVAFIVISRDPVRYRLLMLPAVLEKATYVVATAWLYSAGRIAEMVLVGGAIDLVLGSLFVAAFVVTSPGRIAGDIPEGSA